MAAEVVEGAGFSYVMTDISETVRLRGEAARARRAGPSSNQNRQARPATAQSGQSQAEQSRIMSPRRVLLIDDDTENLDALRAGLELKGYAVETASNGYEGVGHQERAAF